MQRRGMRRLERTIPSAYSWANVRSISLVPTHTDESPVANHDKLLLPNPTPPSERPRRGPRTFSYLVSGDQAYDPDADGYRGGGFNAVPRHAHFDVLLDHVVDGQVFAFVFTYYDDCTRTPACRCLSQTHGSKIPPIPLRPRRIALFLSLIPRLLRTQRRNVCRSSRIRTYYLPLQRQPSRFGHSLGRR